MMITQTPESVAALETVADLLTVELEDIARFTASNKVSKAHAADLASKKSTLEYVRAAVYALAMGRNVDTIGC